MSHDLDEMKPIQKAGARKPTDEYLPASLNAVNKSKVEICKVNLLVGTLKKVCTQLLQYCK